MYIFISQCLLHFNDRDSISTAYKLQKFGAIQYMVYIKLELHDDETFAKFLKSLSS